jgi:hypothetical protein
MEEKKEKWLNYLALSTVILAVCATLATFKGGQHSTRGVLAQTEAANQWAYFQAKSIKEHTYEIQKERLELELKTAFRKAPPDVAESYNKRLEDYGRKLKKYQTEKAEIEKDARNLETTKSDALRHSRSYGIAVIFLQIAIMLSSIAALMKKKPVWYLGMTTGVAGIVFSIDGFLTFLP